MGGVPVAELGLRAEESQKQSWVYVCFRLRVCPISGVVNLVPEVGVRLIDRLDASTSKVGPHQSDDSTWTWHGKLPVVHPLVVQMRTRMLVFVPHPTEENC